MIVVDASVLANVVGDDFDDGTKAREAVADAGPLAFPDLADVETVAVLRKRWLGGTVTDERFVAALEDLAELPALRVPALPLMWRAYELRENVTAYDAAYVALAEVLDCELVTADERLSPASGIRCRVRLVV